MGGVIAGLWSKYGLWVSYSVLALAYLTFLVAIVDPELRSVDALGGPLFVGSALAILLTLVLLPRMGKAEFRRRYRSLGEFVHQYVRQASPWTLGLHALFFAIGVLITVNAFATVPQNSGVSAVDGMYFLLQDSGRTPISGSQYDVMSAALNVGYPVGAAILFLVPAIIYQLADRHRIRTQPVEERAPT
jgi:hypothetical protein